MGVHACNPSTQKTEDHEFEANLGHSEILSHSTEKETPVSSSFCLCDKGGVVQSFLKRKTLFWLVDESSSTIQILCVCQHSCCGLQNSCPCKEESRRKWNKGTQLGPWPRVRPAGWLWDPAEFAFIGYPWSPEPGQAWLMQGKGMTFAMR
jgi:hypothetical protein